MPAVSPVQTVSDDVPDPSRWTGRVTLADRDTRTYPAQRSLVTGGVYDRAGRALADVTVRLYGKLCGPCGYIYRGAASTNTRGQYGIRWTSPTTSIPVYLRARVIGRGPAMWSNPPRTHLVEPWPLHFARNAIAITGARPDSGASFAGTVLRSDGRASAGRVVKLYTRASSTVGWSYRGVTTSNARGGFRLSTKNPTRAYQVQIRVDRSQVANVAARAFTVPLRPWNTRLRLTSNPTTRPGQSKTIVGVASREDGRGIVGAAVHLYQRSSATQPWQVAVDRAMTDQHGKFTLTYIPASDTNHQLRALLSPIAGYRPAALAGSTGVAKPASVIRITVTCGSTVG